MKPTLFAALALLAPAPMLVVPVAPAVAQTEADCQAQIASLRSATLAVAISGKNADKDRQNLVAKLDAASSELAAGKEADAVGKLADFRSKVQQLAAAGRISSADAAALTAQADQAIACIEAS